MQSWAYLFPGQSSQSVGMGKALAQAYDVARDTFAEADEILGIPLSRLCFEGPAEALTETYNAQPALLVTAVAALRVLERVRPDLPPPRYVAGHSLGEYSALVAAGALSFADAVRLTRARGELMAQAGGAQRGSMVAILRLADDQVAEICARAAVQSGEVVQVANYNAPGQVVISGGAAGVTAASALAREAGARVVPLAVSVPSHSSLMKPAAEAFASLVAQVPLTTPAIPVIGNVNAAPLGNVDAIRAELISQLTSPVRWTASVLRMAEDGVTGFMEIGPGNVLTGLVKRIVPHAHTANVASPEDIVALGYAA